jgi:hypothetical protein
VWALAQGFESTDCTALAALVSTTDDPFSAAGATVYHRVLRLLNDASAESSLCAWGFAQGALIFVKD